MMILTAKFTITGARPRAARKPSKEFCMSRIVHFLKNEDGVTAIEYGLIAVTPSSFLRK